MRGAVAGGLPEGMSPSHWAKLQKLRADVRDRVMERAAIMHEAYACSWATADALALAEAEAQAKLPGVSP